MMHTCTLMIICVQFREAMCKPSAIIRKIVLAMLDTFAKLERYIYLEAISETEMLSEV